MKKTLLRLLLVVGLACGLTPLMSCSHDDDDDVEVVVTQKDLPQAAQTFLNTFFNGYTVLKIEKETNGNITLYDVDLQGGYEVVFNNAGDWIEVDAPDGQSIPDGIAPPVIAEYVNSNYPDYGINEINRTGNGYNVELTTGLDLTFNESGEMTGIGNMY